MSRFAFVRLALYAFWAWRIDLEVIGVREGFVGLFWALERVSGRQVIASNTIKEEYGQIPAFLKPPLILATVKDLSHEGQKIS